MTRSAGTRRVLTGLFALASISASLSVLAASSPQASAPVPAAESSAQSPASITGSTVSYLRQLMDNHQLTELRTTYNGTYGASLLFQADRLTYFVALFHDKEIWRVIQTDTSAKAENIYREFSEQTQKLAQTDIDALRMQAGKDYAAKMVVMNEQRLQNLQRDMARQQQQAQKVAAQQQQAKEQAVALSSDLRTTSDQLGTIEQRIQQLMAQQDNPELVLPTPAAPAGASSVAAPPAASSSP